MKLFPIIDVSFIPCVDELFSLFLSPNCGRDYILLCYSMNLYPYYLNRSPTWNWQFCLMSPEGTFDESNAVAQEGSLSFSEHKEMKPDRFKDCCHPPS